MTLTLEMITVDTTAATSLGQWWAERLGADVVQTNDGWFVVLAGGRLPCRLAFQQVDAVTPGKNKLHLDLVAEDLDVAVEQLLAAGATLGDRREMAGFAWATMADPDGNEFDVAGAADATPSGADEQ